MFDFGDGAAPDSRRIQSKYPEFPKFDLISIIVLSVFPALSLKVISPKSRKLCENHQSENLCEKICSSGVFQIKKRAPGLKTRDLGLLYWKLWQRSIKFVCLYSARRLDRLAVASRVTFRFFQKLGSKI